MALNRADSCRHFADGSSFQKCLTYYSADYAGKNASWEVVIVPGDLPEGQQTAPTDAQIVAVADVKALALYTAWTAAVDAETLVESAHAGIGGVVTVL